MLVDWARGTVNMLGSWVGRGVGNRPVCMPGAWVPGGPAELNTSTPPPHWKTGLGNPCVPGAGTVDCSGKRVWGCVGGRNAEEVCCK